MITYLAVPLMVPANEEAREAARKQMLRKIVPDRKGAINYLAHRSIVGKRKTNFDNIPQQHARCDFRIVSLLSSAHFFAVLI